VHGAQAECEAGRVVVGEDAIPLRGEESPCERDVSRAIGGDEGLLEEPSHAEREPEEDARGEGAPAHDDCYRPCFWARNGSVRHPGCAFRGRVPGRLRLAMSVQDLRRDAGVTRLAAAPESYAADLPPGREFRTKRPAIPRYIAGPSPVARESRAK